MKPKQKSTLSLAAAPLLRLQLSRFERVHLTLIGCGGTGSHIASGLVAVTQALDARGTPVEMTFVDPDHVERRNVGRQLFSVGDVGQPKAAVLAARLNAAFRLAIGAGVRRVADDESLLSNHHAALNVVVGAVDNREARAVIASAMGKAHGRLWWLDAGNSEHAGQVSLGNRVAAKDLRGAVGLGMLRDLPSPSLINPDLVVAVKPAKPKPGKNGHGANGRMPSCAELTEAGTQGLMVNRMAAAWALALLHDFLLGTVRWFALDFDLAYGGTRVRQLDLPTLAEATGLDERELVAKGKA